LHRSEIEDEEHVFRGRTEWTVQDDGTKGAKVSLDYRSGGASRSPRRTLLRDDDACDDESPRLVRRRNPVEPSLAARREPEPLAKPGLET